PGAPPPPPGANPPPPPPARSRDGGGAAPRFPEKGPPFFPPPPPRGGRGRAPPPGPADSRCVFPQRDRMLRSGRDPPRRPDRHHAGGQCCRPDRGGLAPRRDVPELAGPPVGDPDLHGRVRAHAAVPGAAGAQAGDPTARRRG